MENVVEEWDISDLKNKSVMAYLLDNGSDGYELYLMANGKIKVPNDASSMFSFFANLQIANLSGFDTTNVTNMGIMFEGCNNLVELNISNFNTESVTNFSRMFNGCVGLTELDISSFDTYNVINMNNMFQACTNLNNIYIGSRWIINNETTTTDMFTGCGTSILTLK